MKTAIYSVKHTESGRMYIGQSVNPERRWARHGWKNSGCVKLRNAISKYGKDSFVFRVLFWCPDKEHANDAETLLITILGSVDNGFNITPGGRGTGAGNVNPFFGKKHSPAQKEKWSAEKMGVPVNLSDDGRIRKANSSRNRIWTEESRQKLRERPPSALCRERTAAANRARVWTPEARLKQAVNNTGRTMSEETKAKIAAANRARVWTDASRAKLAASKAKGRMP